MRSAVIVDVVRTASGKGKPGGALSSVHPVNLFANTLRALLARTDVNSASIDDVIAGCVSQAGEQTLNIARNAVLAAGIPESVPGTTVDRQCGSSQQAVHFAAQGVLAGAYDIVLAGGVESMSRVPMGYSSVGQHPTAPLAERYPEGLIGQGVSAELIAAKWKFDRETLDAYSARSHQRAAQTAADGGFGKEVVPIEVDGEAHDTDQTLRASTTVEGLSGLQPSFVDEGLERRFPEIEWRITSGNSSPLTDADRKSVV